MESAQSVHDHTISAVGMVNSVTGMHMRSDNFDLSNAVGNIERSFFVHLKAFLAKSESFSSFFW